jgi:hypothetical protein
MVPELRDSQHNRTLTLKTTEVITVMEISTIPVVQREVPRHVCKKKIVASTGEAVNTSHSLPKL